MEAFRATYVQKCRDFVCEPINPLLAALDAALAAGYAPVPCARCVQTEPPPPPQQRRRRRRESRRRRARPQPLT